MNDQLFARADQAINRAQALREERQRLREAAERLLDRQHEITQCLAAYTGSPHSIVRFPND
jgi:hypothetical protein